MNLPSLSQSIGLAFLTVIATGLVCSLVGAVLCKDSETSACIYVDTVTDKLFNLAEDTTDTGSPLSELFPH